MGTNTNVPAFLFLREWIQIVLRKAIGDVNENEMPRSVCLWTTVRTEKVCASNLYTYISQMTKDELIKEMGY